MRTFRQTTLKIGSLLACLALTLSCMSRVFNADEQDSSNDGPEAQSFKPAPKPKGMVQPVLTITALKNTVLKSEGADIKQASYLPVSQKCFIKAGQTLTVTGTLKQTKAGHYKVTFAAPPPALREPASQIQTNESQVSLRNLTRSDIGSPEKKTMDEKSMLPLNGKVAPAWGRMLELRPEPKPTTATWVAPLPKAGAKPEFANDTAPCAFQTGWIFEDDWQGDVLDPEASQPKVVSQFFDKFKSCSAGASYSLGASSCNSSIDCSNVILRAYQMQSLPIVSNQTDQDPNFVACKAGDYKAGDHLLLGYSCSDPDHWVTLYKVNNRDDGNSPANVIIDVSSDCNGLCPTAPVRSNLAARVVCACARHKSFEAAWKGL